MNGPYARPLNTSDNGTFTILGLDLLTSAKGHCYLVDLNRN